jgi:hypothetical protein
MIVERLFTKVGVLPYLRRRWRDDQRRATDKIDARVDKHVARLDGQVERMVERIEQLDGVPEALAETSAKLEMLEQALKSVTRQTRQLRAVLSFNSEHREDRHPSHVFENDQVARHVAAAIERTRVDSDPMAHVVVDALLPRETYDALVDAIPPEELFADKDQTKQNFKLHTADVAPEWTATAFGFMEQAVIPRMMVPGLLQKFDAHIDATYRRKYGPILGPRVKALPHIATAGRLMLRRPGYHLDPHLDPDRVVVTCLIYFARPGDDASFGTTFYRIDGEPVIDRRSTYYPGHAGHRCELVKTAPFRPNTAVAFVNAGGAHGADIPASAPAGTERYAYQFYVSPDQTALDALIPSSLENAGVE